MGSVCWRSHDHTVSDKDKALMRKVHERREQIRPERREGGKGGEDNKKTKGKGGGKDKKNDGKNEATPGANAKAKAKAAPEAK